MQPIPEPPRQWAYFARADLLDGVPLIGGGALTRYTFEYSKQIRGTPLLVLNSGDAVARVISNVPINLDMVTRDQVLSGGTQHLHYTTQAQRSHLVAISAKEFPASNRTRAVLIPISKSKEWWNLAHDARASHFARSASTEGHTAIGEAFAGKIYRQLLHARYLESSAKRCDFLTYFEFPEEETAAFVELLKRLRDEQLNPEWRHVELEQEIWMRKIQA